MDKSLQTVFNKLKSVCWKVVFHLVAKVQAVALLKAKDQNLKYTYLLSGGELDVKVYTTLKGKKLAWFIQRLKKNLPTSTSKARWFSMLYRLCLNRSKFSVLWGKYARPSPMARENNLLEALRLSGDVSESRNSLAHDNLWNGKLVF